MTDVGTTPRLAMGRMRRLRIFEAGKGTCCLCGQRIDGTKQRWIVEHIRPLELGGADEDANCAPAHEFCGIEKTKVDHALAAKAKRMKARHLGIAKTPSRPMPGSRQSGWRKPFNRPSERRT